VLRWAQGRLEEVEEMVRRSAEEYPTYVVWRCVLACMAAELGDETESRKAFETLAGDDFAELPFDEEWLVSMSFLAVTASSLGDTKRSSILYQLLLPYADRVAIATPEISIGSVSRYLGLLAATTARWADAERHFETAIEMNERIGARPWLAQTQHEYARLLLTRDRPGGQKEALELLDRALAICRELGMESYAAAVSALREAGATAP
jgi:tetratricopeptide (TPR) repeat protein